MGLYINDHMSYCNICVKVQVSLCLYYCSIYNNGIKSRTAVAERKTALNKKKACFTTKLDLNLKKKPINCYIRC